MHSVVRSYVGEMRSKTFTIEARRKRSLSGKSLRESVRLHLRRQKCLALSSCMVYTTRLSGIP